MVIVQNPDSARPKVIVNLIVVVVLITITKVLIPRVVVAGVLGRTPAFVKEC